MKKHSSIYSEKLKNINTEIESLRKQLTSHNLSSEDREDCEEKLLERLYDKKTFINPKTQVTSRKSNKYITQIDPTSIMKCLVENAIKGTLQWIIQKKEKQPLCKEFEEDALWIFYSGKKIKKLLTFNECCSYLKMNVANIRYAIYRISTLKTEQIKELTAKFKIKQERKYNDESLPIDYNFSQFYVTIPHSVSGFSGSFNHQQRGAIKYERHFDSF